jgi:ATP-binding cassette subfamily B protein
MGSLYNIRFILESINQFKYWVVGLFIIAIIGAIDLSLRPYLLKVMLDKITFSEPNMLFTTLLFPVILYILISIIEVIVFRFYDFFWLKLKPNLQKYIGIKLLNRMMAHSADLYENHFAGSLVNKINDVIGGIPNIIRICVDQIFGNTLSMVIATVTLYYVSPRIAIVFILWAVIFIIISFKFAAVAGNLSKVTAEVKSKLVGYKVDALSNITSIRLFTGKEIEVQRFTYAFNLSRV